jgi:hypothetical protein
MNPHLAPCGRLSALASVILVSLVTLVALAGCSNQPQQLVGPAQSSARFVAASDPSNVLAESLQPIDRRNYPRIRVWTDDGWRRFQKEGGVSLEPSRIYDLEIPELQPVTFHWAAQPQGQSLGTRWVVDISDILDETPRSGPDDFAHWSAWSASETSATVGPFDASPDSGVFHWFYVEARDNLGLLSLLTVRMRVLPASDAVAEDVPATRR